MKRFKYLILACLVTTAIMLPSVTNSTTPKILHLNVQIAQNSTVNNAAEQDKIKQALLADAAAQNWKPQIGTITIVNNYAIAATYDEVTGGESVLQKQQGVWRVVGGTGGAFSRPKDLVAIANVPVPIARQLLKLRAEQKE